MVAGGEESNLSLESQSKVYDRDLRRLQRLQKERADAVTALRQRDDLTDLGLLLEMVSVYASSAVHARTPQRQSLGRRGLRQHEMSEDQEDRELMEDELVDDVSTRLTVQPSSVKGGSMRQYQLDGLNWLIRLYENGLNGILADEMGLGKTMQSISLLGYLQSFRGVEGPHLVIAPKTTLGNWQRELARWAPSLSVVRFHGDQDQRAEIMAEALSTKFHVCLTTYEVAIREKAFLRKFDWFYLVVDEAHRLKNDQSVLSQVLRSLTSRHRLLLTGTPLQNNLHELWALLNFVLPELFSDSEAFDELTKKQTSVESVVQQLHRVLRPFILRRLKAEVERTLPPKKETKLYIAMSEMQRHWYRNMLLRDLEALNATNTSGGGDGGVRMRLLNILMQLRKVCNHPYLFDGAEPGPPFEEGEHLIENSGKLVLMDKLLPRLKSGKHRVLVFSQMTRMLDILEDYMRFRGYAYCRIDGSTSSEEREESIADYNREDSDKFVFLLSTRAGGLGINLVSADTVILYDSDWNPQMDLQAQDRCHRIGQTRPVNVYRFVVQDTVEEKIVERAERKLHLDALVIQQGRLVENHAVDKDDLRAMLRFGADLVIHASDKAGNISDADLEEILQRGEARTKELSDRITEAAKKLGGASDLLKLDGTNMYEFEGENFQAAGSSALRGDWIEMPKREHKQTFNVDQYFRDALTMQKFPKERKERVGRGPRQPHISDFQFYPPALKELLKRERRAFRRQHNVPADSDSSDNGEGTYEPLTEAEQEEKERLLKMGFADWTRAEFRSGVHGRGELAKIAEELQTKTEADVRAYSEVFWKRIAELEDSDGIVRRIEEGERKLKKLSETSETIAYKIDKHARAGTPVSLAYGRDDRGPHYTELADAALVVYMHECEYGNWEAIQERVVHDHRFLFDFFLRSRTPLELQRRCEKLVRMIERERTGGGEESSVSFAAAPAVSASSAAPKKKQTKLASTAAGSSASKRTKGSRA